VILPVMPAFLTALTKSPPPDNADSFRVRRNRRAQTAAVRPAEDNYERARWFFQVPGEIAQLLVFFPLVLSKAFASRGTRLCPGGADGAVPD
jgi:hypothetical protein